MMFESPGLQYLQRLQPEAAHELASVNSVARQVLDPALMALCSDCVDALLRRQSWSPPHGLDARGRAFVDFTEQFVTSVSAVTREQVDALKVHASPDEIYLFANALYVIEMTRRVELVSGRVFND